MRPFKKQFTAAIFILAFATCLPAQTPKSMLRLPDSGQTASFTDTFGEDSDYTQHPPFFQINGNGTVTDTVTGLLWQQVDGGEMTYESAQAYCDTLSLAGFTDWRLPTAQEAFSILNHGLNNPAMDVAAFPDTDAEYWWTGEQQFNNANKIWVTNAGGGIGNHLKTETISAGGTKRFHVRAVREMQAVPQPPAHFTTLDSIVLDNFTGLEWQHFAAADSMGWEEALVFAEGLTQQGKSDWRLPNVKELESINDETTSQPSINTSIFEGIVAKKYWTSTTLNNQPTKAWFMDARFGVVSYDLKTAKNLLLCVRGGTEAPPLPSAILQHAEILGRPTDHSITVQAFFYENVEVSVGYGVSSGNLTQQTPWQPIAAGDPAEVVLENLAADTRYFYQFAYRLPGPGAMFYQPERTFHTQRPAGSSFSFVIQADPHLDEMSDTALYRLCLQNQLADAPDFMVDLGDVLMSDKLKNAQNQITHDTVTYRAHYMRSYYETASHSVPLFMVLGNHEGEAGWQLNGTVNNVAVYDALDRKKYFLNPAPDGFYTGDETDNPFVGQRESYYAWEWGDALFVVLDPYWYTSPKPDSLTGWRWTLGKTQYDWLRATLEGSSAKFKFVFSHQLVGGDPLGRGGIEFADRYEWGGQNLDGSDGWAVNRPGWYKPIKEILKENRVTAFFHGHDHFFAKQEKDCLIYQECPQPSLPNFQNANQADDYGYFAGQILPNAGHLRITVSPDGVKTEYVRAYLPQNETATRHNRDVSATYFIGETNCYDSLSTGAPVIWNANYSDELIYPNPSAGEVKIEFSLAQAERLDLGVFDEKGALVRRLVAGSLVPAGKFQIVWDGRNGSGAAVPGGLYFYKIRGENSEMATGKLVLMR
ncbi:MAG: DUF1566 domain-containing protein [Saprospiraceae bacterium]|nr:DUF1566 domain-containing protein [Saprospiraceae bacterium]